jgi:hypothetical protein
MLGSGEEGRSMLRPYGARFNSRATHPEVRCTCLQGYLDYRTSRYYRDIIGKSRKQLRIALLPAGGGRYLPSPISHNSTSGGK